MTTSILPAALTETEAAVFLSTSKPTLKRWRREGGGPKFMAYGPQSIRYRVKDLEKWLADQPSYRNGGEMQ